MKLLKHIKNLHRKIKRLEEKLVCFVFPSMRVAYFERKVREILGALRSIHSEVKYIDGIIQNMAGKLKSDLIYLEYTLERLLSVGIHSEFKPFVLKMHEAVRETAFICGLSLFYGKKFDKELAKIEEILKTN